MTSLASFTSSGCASSTLSQTTFKTTTPTFFLIQPHQPSILPQSRCIPLPASRPSRPASRLTSFAPRSAGPPLLPPLPVPAVTGCRSHHKPAPQSRQSTALCSARNRSTWTAMRRTCLSSSRDRPPRFAVLRLACRPFKLGEWHARTHTHMAWITPTQTQHTHTQMKRFLRRRRNNTPRGTGKWQV